MSRSKLSNLRLEDVPEFRKGAEEFAKELSKCPACAIRLALELVDSKDPEDKQLLKDLLTGLGRKLMELEAEQRSSHTTLKDFPLIEGWLRGEVGLGIIAKLFRGRE